jgi:ankyrin repeat protein
LTPLCSATYNKEHGGEIITCLLANGADINAHPMNDDGVTALHLAVANDNAGAVDALISGGIDTQVRDRRNVLTALDLAEGLKARCLRVMVRRMMMESS